jgi:hypothetical protein
MAVRADVEARTSKRRHSHDSDAMKITEAAPERSLCVLHRIGSAFGLGPTAGMSDIIAGQRMVKGWSLQRGRLVMCGCHCWSRSTFHVNVLTFVNA